MQFMNYDLQREAVHESINFSDFTYFSEMSLEDYKEIKNSETWYISFYNTAIYEDVQRLWKLVVVWELRPITEPI